MERRAIVTGASSGIGRETVRELAKEGWRVLAVARREERLRALREEFADQIQTHVCDVTGEGAAEAVLAAANEQLGGIDLLVNNAGTSWVGQFADMPVADLDRVFNLNVRALMRLCQAAIPSLEASGRGQIINVASVAGHLPMSSLAAYCSSKAAVIMFSNVLAKELSPRGIRVNVLSPTGTDTEIFEKCGVTVDPVHLVPAPDMARLVVVMTQLPEGVDLGEVVTQKRLSP
ncbi:MAG: SDR family oxidoreductase [Armatimonadetes bacterium]|nr:SDR family oxidoreductase [Armatimonadota bacterium]